MFRLLLYIFLIHSAFGKSNYLDEDKDFEGPERYLILDPTGYFRPIDPRKPTELNCSDPTSLHGKPHYLWGIWQAGDRKTYFNRVSSRGKFFGRMRDYLYIEPEEIAGVITSIQVYDRKWSRNGGNVEPVKGGLGQNFVYLRFESKWNGSFDYLVSVFVKQD